MSKRVSSPVRPCCLRPRSRESPVSALTLAHPSLGSAHSHLQPSSGIPLEVALLFQSQAVRVRTN